MLDLGEAHTLADLIELPTLLKTNWTGRFGFADMRSMTGSLYPARIEDTLFLSPSSLTTSACEHRHFPRIARNTKATNAGYR
ncbi:MAG: hypothetical protein U1E63_03815 [Burkholderiales bacterium]